MQLRKTSGYRIGTRGSPLAVFQAEYVKQQLEKIHRSTHFEIKTITTSGDIHSRQDLSSFTTKNIFIKEIQDALLNDEIDIAVHSLKDMSSKPSSVFITPACLFSGDRTDTLIHRLPFSLAERNHPYVFGTSSPRRIAQLKSLFPHCVSVPLRGNVQSRLLKFDSQTQWTGILLSKAGLDRLNICPEVTYHFNASEFVPAGGQGIIAVECLQNRSETVALIKSINEPQAQRIREIEMGFLCLLDVSCHFPIGIHFDPHTHQAYVFATKPDHKLHVKFSSRFEEKAAVTEILATLYETLNQKWQTVTGSLFHQKG